MIRPDLTPAAQRPWVGGSQANSVLDLALNYNGLGRVTGNEGVGGGFRGGPPPGGQPGFGGNNRFAPPGGFTPPGGFVPGGNGGPGGGRTFGGPGGPGGGGGMFGAGFAGPLRLFFGGELAEQWSFSDAPRFFISPVEKPMEKLPCPSVSIST